MITQQRSRTLAFWISRSAVRIGMACCAVWMASAATALCQTLNMSLSPTNFVFASADPDTTPIITANNTITVTYRVRMNGGGSWRITLLANGDLTSGGATIPIGNVTWTGTPAPPFQNGTLSASVAQTLASGSGNVNPEQTGNVLFQLANSWNYSTGIYGQTVVFTLSAP